MLYIKKKRNLHNYFVFYNVMKRPCKNLFAYAHDFKMDFYPPASLNCNFIVFLKIFVRCEFGQTPMYDALL